MAQQKRRSDRLTELRFLLTLYINYGIMEYMRNHSDDNPSEPQIPAREMLPEGDELSELGKAFVQCVEYTLKAEAAAMKLDEDAARPALIPSDRLKLRHACLDSDILASQFMKRVRELALAETKQNKSD